LLQRLYC